jgi:hypothetical protein
MSRLGSAFRMDWEGDIRISLVRAMVFPMAEAREIFPAIAPARSARPIVIGNGRERSI